jgi:hypothetical protein
MWKHQVFNIRITLIVFVALVFGTFLEGCYTGPPERNFSDTDLLIEVSDMPDGWEEAEFIASEKYSKEGADNRALRYFSFTLSPYFVKAGEDVYHYRSQSSAERGYKVLEQLYMEQNSRKITPWETPQGFDFTSSIASQWRFACVYSTFAPAESFGNNRQICKFLAQYEEFVIKFGVTIEVEGENIISIEDVTKIIITIDQKMMEALQS